MINFRKKLKFTGKIDDDVALRFNGNFLRELDNLILYKVEEFEGKNSQPEYKSKYSMKEHSELK
jgi:hypothetical protein